jgi:two-component system chemotaxis response regulator CheB
MDDHPTTSTPVQTLIVIGASAGGIEAIKQVLAKVPADIPAAIAIVLHTGPNGPRLLADIWAKHTHLPVNYALGQEMLAAGHVYIAPPDQHLEVTGDGRLHLDDGPRVLYSRPSADRLFETAVEAFAKRTIGVVLTGGDGDGAAGMRAIYAAGGIGVVQEPSDAADPSMPLTTLRTDHPRYCVPLRDIGALLGELAVRLTQQA